MFIHIYLKSIQRNKLWRPLIVLFRDLFRLETAYRTSNERCVAAEALHKLTAIPLLDPAVTNQMITAADEAGCGAIGTGKSAPPVQEQPDGHCHQRNESAKIVGDFHRPSPATRCERKAFGGITMTIRRPAARPRGRG
jgi:hypothetical protein